MEAKQIFVVQNLEWTVKKMPVAKWLIKWGIWEWSSSPSQTRDWRLFQGLCFLKENRPQERLERVGWQNYKEFAQYTHTRCEMKTVFGAPLAFWNYLHLDAYLTYRPRGRVEIRCVLWIVLERWSLSTPHGSVLPKLGPWVRGGSMWWDLLLPRHPGGKHECSAA